MVELAARFSALGSEPGGGNHVEWLLWQCRRQRLLALWHEGNGPSRDVHLGRLRWFQSELLRELNFRRDQRRWLSA